MVQRKYNTVTGKRVDGKTVTRNVSLFKKVFLDKSKDEYDDIKRLEKEKAPKEEPSVKKINKD